MAVALGNLALLLDVASPRKIIADRKTRPMLLDVVLSHYKRDPLGINASTSSHVYHYCSLANKAFLESDGEDARRQRAAVARGKANSKVNGVDYDSDEESGNEDGEDEAFDLEKKIRKRVEEIEEMRELEKKAEELQSIAEEESGGNEDRKETEEEKKMRVRKELEKVAKERAERRATAQLMFDLGQKAYGRGMYGRSIEFLEGALTIIPGPTLFGGEIQIWLAMAYEANNRHEDCIALYQHLEKKHPCISVRRQAAELRYILQAPKIKITQEEMVTIPPIGSSYDSYASTWSDKYKDNGSVTSQLPSRKDYLADFLVWKPPIGLEKNTTFWVALTLWLGLVGAALILQR